jgi:hypothetical protein
MSTALTEPQRRKLNDLESIIEHGLQTFVEVGAALAIILEQKLYRTEYATYEAYVEARWGWSAARARQLIGSAKVVEEIAESVTEVTLSEPQARELIPVPEGQRAEALATAQQAAQDEGKPLSADHVRDARRQHTPITERKKRKPAKQKSRTEQDRETRERNVKERERAAKAARKAEENAKTEGGDAPEPAPAPDHRGADVSGHVTVGESDEPRTRKPSGTGATGREIPSSGSPSSDKDERLAYLLTAESALAHAASFRGLGQSAVQQALDIVREVVEMLRAEEAA